jgi:hypothetical protein
MSVVVAAREDLVEATREMVKGVLVFLNLLGMSRVG